MFILKCAVCNKATRHGLVDVIPKGGGDSIILFECEDCGQQIQTTESNEVADMVEGKWYQMGHSTLYENY